MDLNKKVVEKYVTRFLASDEQRSYKTLDASYEKKTFVLEFEEVKDELGWHLDVTDWGHCYETLKVPSTWAELVNLKVRAQLDLLSIESQVAVRFYLGLMRAIDDATGWTYYEL